MKPKFANFSDYYDQIEIYTASGERTSTGGYEETQTLVNTVWADVRISSGGENIDIERGNRREFTKRITVKLYSGFLTEGQLISYKGIKAYVVEVDRSNSGYDVAYCEQTK